MSKTNKFILWCVLVAIASFWMWAGVHGWLQGSLFQIGRYQLVIMSALFIFLLSLLAIGLILFRNRLWVTYLGLISAITFSMVFGISNINLVGMFILVMLFFHAQDIVYDEMAERIKMNSRVLLRKGLTNFVVAFFILISFVAYQSPAIESFKNITELPSASSVFIRQVAEQTLSDQLAEIEPGQKEMILNQITQEMIGEINTILAPYFEYTPPALAFGLFLVLWGIGWIFIWLAVFLGVFIFWILRKINFFKIEERDVKAEVITI